MLHACACQGVKVSPAVKLLGVMALTNLSFDKRLAADMAQHPKVFIVPGLDL
jgi:hypothetical protein